MAPIPPKKIFQTPTENVIEPIQATSIIVIHPGSMFLRIGRPSEPYPITVPHVIARRCKPGSIPNVSQYLVQRVIIDSETKASVEDALHSTQRLLTSCLTSEGTMRYVGSRDTIREYNEKSKPIIDNLTTVKKQISTFSSQDVLVGQDVLDLGDSNQFHVNWPIRRGQLNIHSGTGGSLTAIIADLESIWSTTINKYLENSSKDLSAYRAVLVIPDIYDRTHVKEIVNMLLNNMGFGGCFLHLESVCATFGAGLSYACVIDVGDHKTSVSCVEDGISHRKTRLTMEYGGSDLTQLFFSLLVSNSFPYRTCNPSILSDAMLLQELKENFCHLNLDICGLHERGFTVKQLGQPKIKYSIMLGEECLISPLALFTPELIAITGPKRTRIQHVSDGDSEDPHDENYLILTQRRGVKEPSDCGTQNSDLQGQMLIDENQDDDLDVTSECQTNYGSGIADSEKEIQCNQLYSVDQAVLQSIERCDSDEMKRKMYSCLLVIGGGMMFPGIHTWLRNRLSVQTPLNYRGEELEIFVRPKDMDPRITVWKGAAVMSCLDTAQELWISAKEWQRYGIKVLRERAPFTW